MSDTNMSPRPDESEANIWSRLEAERKRQDEIRARHSVGNQQLVLPRAKSFDSGHKTGPAVLSSKHRPAVFYVPNTPTGETVVLDPHHERKGNSKKVKSVVKMSRDEKDMMEVDSSTDENHNGADGERRERRRSSHKQHDRSSSRGSSKDSHTSLVSTERRPSGRVKKQISMAAKIVILHLCQRKLQVDARSSKFRWTVL